MWRALLQEHEPWKPPEPPNIPFDPSNPMKYVQVALAEAESPPSRQFFRMQGISPPRAAMRQKETAQTAPLSRSLP
jgi:hypothetical protein